MELFTTQYIISQILVIIMYLLLCSTYFLKSRTKILFINVVLNIIQSVSFLLLGGFTGMTMNFFNIARDSFLYVDNKTNKNSEEPSKRDYIILIVFFIIITIFSIISYNNIWSLLTIVATIISTVSIWQKNPRIYKALGIPSSALYLGYHIALKSIFAIILEGILLISTIIGYILDVEKFKYKEKSTSKI